MKTTFVTLDLKVGDVTTRTFRPAQHGNGWQVASETVRILALGEVEARKPYGVCREATVETVA